MSVGDEGLGVGGLFRVPPWLVVLIWVLVIVPGSVAASVLLQASPLVVVGAPTCLALAAVVVSHISCAREIRDFDRNLDRAKVIKEITDRREDARQGWSRRRRSHWAAERAVCAHPPGTA